MNIVMMTNSYIPMVGGLEQSVQAFTESFRKLGHKVLIVTPETDKRLDDPDIEYVPAVKLPEGSRFYLPLPVPGYLNDRLNRFKPDIFHSHHPFLLGDTALHAAEKYGAPLVYTNHTLYERYENYMPFNSTTLTKLVMALSVGYANLCDRVIAPSESIAVILRERGVQQTISVIPTGIDIDRYANGDGLMFRQSRHIPEDATVFGIISRIDAEKNIIFLGSVVSEYMRTNDNIWFLVVGDGDSASPLKKHFEEQGLANRLVMTGNLKGDELINAYHTLDVFVFASKTETQGIVLAEAMASGKPIIGLDAPGVRDIIRDKINGRLVKEETSAAFIEAFQWFEQLDSSVRKNLSEEALKSAAPYDIMTCASSVLELYTESINEGRFTKTGSINLLDDIKATLKTEWELFVSTAHAASSKKS